MWSRTCSAALALAAVACGSGDRRRIDVCGRGDRAELAAALEGGRFRLEVTDGVGEVLERAETSTDGRHAVDLDVGGAAAVRVVGLDAAGADVAFGSAAIGGGDICVCLAFAGRWTGACEGIACRVESDACAFEEADTGLPAGTRMLTFDPIADTTLGAVPDGLGPLLTAGDVALRWDLSVLPRDSVIDGALLDITPTMAGGPVSAFRAIEEWDEATANDVLREDTPAARFYLDEGEVSVDIDATVASWVGDPAESLGLVLHEEGSAASFPSRESDSPPPYLTVRYHLPGDTGAIGTGAYPCGNGLVDGAEECDDADADDLDGCTNACLLARCGDGLVRRGVEDCDDGNTIADDGCSADCLACADPDAAATTLGANGHCYALYSAPRNYNNAESFCDFAKHAIVASFETEAEQDAIRAALGLNAVTWIGLNDRSTEGTYRWTSGEDATYTDWAAMEPTGAAEDCVALNVNGNWLDDLCSASHPFVCERDPWTLGAAGHAYRPVTGASADFVEARGACQLLAADLATINDATENSLLAGALGFDSWVGLTELGHEGTLAWASGEAFDFDGFSGTPNLDGGPFCVTLLRSGSWATLACATGRRYLCESR